MGRSCDQKGSRKDYTRNTNGYQIQQREDQKVEGPGEKGHKKINGVEEGLRELEANSSRGQILLKVLIYYEGKYLRIGCS